MLRTAPDGTVHVAITAENGAWGFEGLAPNRYHVKVAAPGFYEVKSVLPEGEDDGEDEEDEDEDEEDEEEEDE